MKYTDLPLDNIQLNLSKNRLQPAYWENINAYAADNMLQPTLTQTTQYKDNFVIGDDLYSVKNKQLYKNGALFHDFSGEELTFTEEFDGWKRNFFYLTLDGKFIYYNTVLLSGLDYDSTTMWTAGKNAIILTADGIYSVKNGSIGERQDIPEFDFSNCVQINKDNGIYLFEGEAKRYSDSTKVCRLRYLTPDLDIYTKDIQGTYDLAAIYPGQGCQGGGVIFTMNNVKSYKVVIDTSGERIRLFPTDYTNETVSYESAVSVISHETIIDEGTIGEQKEIKYDAAYATATLRFYRYLYGDIGPDNQLITNSYRYENVSTIQSYSPKGKIKGVPGNSTEQLVKLNDNVGYAFVKIWAEEPDDSIHTESAETAFYFDNNIESDGITTAAYRKTDPNSIRTDIACGISLCNSPSFANSAYNDFMIIREKGIIKSIAYKNKIITIPYTIDSYYQNAGKSIYVYSSTAKKSFRILVGTGYSLKLQKVGDSIITNSFTASRIDKTGIKTTEYNIGTFAANTIGVRVRGIASSDGFHEYGGWTKPTYNKTEYIAQVSNGCYGGAEEVYLYGAYSDGNRTSQSTVTEIPPLKDLLKSFNVSGKADIYLGETGTVEYSFSINNNFTYVKNLEKEYGISEEAQYVLPVTDDIKVLLDYDIFNTYIKVQGFTIKLSVINNEIQSVVTLASLDTDVDEIFTLQGQGYQIINNKIYSFSATAESGLSDQQFIVSCPFKYLGYDDTVAYFWDPLTKNVVCFQGNNQMNILQSMSLLDKIVFSDYDVAHRALVIGTTNKTYLKLYNNWMSFNFPTNTSAVFYKDSILLDNKKLVLGQGTLDIQTGWIYNNTANQPLITAENIFITLLSAGNIDVYVEFLSPDKKVSSMAKHYTDVEYAKVSVTRLLTRAIRIRIQCNKPVTGITIAADDKVNASPISNRQAVEI